MTLPIASADAAILSLEFTNRAYARSAHTLDPGTGQMQLDLPAALLLAAATTISCYGPNYLAARAGFDDIAQIVRGAAQALGGSEAVDAALTDLAASPSAGEAGVTAAYSKRLNAIVRICASAAMEDQSPSELPGPELASACRSWADALLVMRRLELDPQDLHLPALDGYMLINAVTSFGLQPCEGQNEIATRLREAIFRMGAAYISEEILDEPGQAGEQADTWFERALEILAEANTPEDEMIPAILASMAPARPQDEREWGLFEATEAVVLSAFLVLGVGWDEERVLGQDDADEAMGQFDAAMAGWFMSLMACREMFASGTASA